MSRSRRQPLLWLALTVVLTFGGLDPASAQIASGSVAGVIKDGQGGVVPGATVELISEQRGTKGRLPIPEPAFMSL